MKTIAVFTGTRADYGLLKRVMQLLMKQHGCLLFTIVSGTHLSSIHGHTIDEILADGIPVSECIEIPVDNGSPAEVSSSMGVAIGRYAEMLTRRRPDILVLLGDRFEALALALAATFCGVPIAHIHGGEVTEGAIDDAFRHAITKMSHLHFASCEVHRQRIIQLGEFPDRVFTVGALGVEQAKLINIMPEDVLRKELCLDTSSPYFLCTFHPVTREIGQGVSQVSALLDALDAFPEYSVIFTAANVDCGGDSINKILCHRAECDPRYRFFPSLGQKRYLAAASHAVCVLGNSSSALIEVPSLGTPVVDIGSRQKGRMRAISVIHCSPDPLAIYEAINLALAGKYNQSSVSITNPYEQIGTSQKIVDILLDHHITAEICKPFYDIKTS